MKFSPKTFSAFCAFVGVANLLPTSASAQLTTWSYKGPAPGTVETPTAGALTTAANWDGGALPAFDGQSSLSFGGTGGITLTGTARFNQLVLAATGSGTTTLNGALTLAKSGGAGDPTFLKTGAGNYLLSGAFDLGSQVVTISGSGGGTTKMSGVISGTGGRIVMDSASALELTGLNTYSGGFTMNSGTVLVGGSNVFGSGTLRLNGGRVQVNSGGGYVLQNQVVLGSGITLGGGAGGNLDFRGLVTLTDANTAINVVSGMTFNGGITGEGMGFVKTGNGILQITSQGTYTGTTTVRQGRLDIGGNAISGDMVVENSGLVVSIATNAFRNPTNMIVRNGGAYQNYYYGNASMTLNSLQVGSSTDAGGYGLTTFEMGLFHGANSMSLSLSGTGDILKLEGSNNAQALLDLGGYVGTIAGQILLTSTATGTNSNLTFGKNSYIFSGDNGGYQGSIVSKVVPTADNYINFNFNGASIESYGYDGETVPLYQNSIMVGNDANQGEYYYYNVNINDSLGDGTGNLIVTGAKLNLGWTGTINMGALISTRVANGNNTPAPNRFSVPVIVKNSATGMIGGTIYASGSKDTGSVGNATTSLTFESAPEAQTFTLGVDESEDNPVNNVGIIDVRAAADGVQYGRITQNNINLHIDGGILKGNYLVDSGAGGGGNGNVTISNGGSFILANDTRAYTVSFSGAGANNRTIYMQGPNAGYFALGGAGTSLITVDTPIYGNGVWTNGRLVASGGHSISDGGVFSSSSSTAGNPNYISGLRIKADTGLEGLVINNAAPFASTDSGVAVTTALTLEGNSSFLLRNTATSGTNPTTYYLGTAAALSALSAPATKGNVGIETPGGENFFFGYNHGMGTKTATASSIQYSGGDTASITLNADAITSYGLTEGGRMEIASTSGSNNSYYNGQFVITKIEGTKVTFALNELPPTTSVPTSTGATIRVGQTAFLLSDKGNGNGSVVLNGSGGTIRISGNQTGSGNLYLNAAAISLDEGKSFSGTGGIYSGSTVVGSGWTNDAGITRETSAYGAVNGSAGVATIFNVAGALGTSSEDRLTVSLNMRVANVLNGGDGGIRFGTTASLDGQQTWRLFGLSGRRDFSIFANRMTDASKWKANVDLYFSGNTGMIEASTSASGLSSNYKFGVFDVNFHGGANGIGRANVRLVNQVQNDGAGTKEAFYADSLNVTTSGQSNLLNLGGQDFFLKGFAQGVNSYNSGSSAMMGYSWVNDTINSTSVIQRMDNLGRVESLASGGFRVLNNATIEVKDGNWFSHLWGGSTDFVIAADIASAPNAGANTNSSTSQGRVGAANLTSYMGFLGSSYASGNNTSTTATKTDGGFKVTNGNFSASNLILNPVGTRGSLSATLDNGAALGKVTFRSNASQRTTFVLGSSWVELLSEQIYSVGDVVAFTGSNSTAYGVRGDRFYYVVGVNGNKIQVSLTPGGTPMVAIQNAENYLSIQDLRTHTQVTNAPGLIVAGTTTVNGHLHFSNAPGAVTQSTLRVGGITNTLTTTDNVTLTNRGVGYTNGSGQAVTVNYTTDGVAGTIQGTATVTSGTITSLVLNRDSVTGANVNGGTVFGAISGIGTPGTNAVFTGVFDANNYQLEDHARLNVEGDLSIGATNNFALHSNGVIDVKGNVSILGVGATNTTAARGVGIDTGSHFYLSGNSTSVYQEVNIVPTVGNFHIGQGSAGDLNGDGRSAMARLTNNLTVAGGIDVNGADSRLDINGHELRLNDESKALVVGGRISGAGTIVGNVNYKSTASASSNFSGTISDKATDEGLNNGYLSTVTINSGTLILSGSSNYTGATTVNGGRLVVNGSLAALNTTTVKSGGSLSGTGTLGNLVVENGGIHTPGNSPGVQTAAGDATYKSGSVLQWQLESNFAQATLQTGSPVFDQVKVGGALGVEGGASFNITLNTSGSVVSFEDGFWDSNQRWLVIADAVSRTGDFAIGSISLDTHGRLYEEFGVFSLTWVDRQLMLDWTAIPEPSTYLLALLGVGAVAIRYRRRG